MLNFLLTPSVIIPLIIAIIVISIVLSGYVKAPPDKAIIISGFKKNPRILVGRAGIKIPFLERKDALELKMISVDVKDMPEFFREERFDGNSMMCKKLEMLPIECIVRGYITGSGWESYKENGTVCGIKLPEGLQESDKLPEPIFTPSTKAEIGLHDENISFERCREILEKEYPGKGASYAEQIKDYTIALYKKCAEYALTKGIIIADTKFEFGLDENGNVVLGDEMLTPDSSRFWPLEGYKPGQGQPSFDKQFVRDWLKANPDSDYLLPDDVIEKTVNKYKEAYELLTGKKFA